MSHGGFATTGYEKARERDTGEADWIRRPEIGWRTRTRVSMWSGRLLGTTRSSPLPLNAVSTRRKV